MPKVCKGGATMIFEVMFKSFLGACGVGVLTLITMGIKWLWKKLKIDNITIEALAHDAYYRHCRYLLQGDTITEEELENHNHLYKAYKAQGLNGTGDRMHELILEKQVTILASHKLP